ncbi:glycosyltransferase family 4 protein [Verrucomicrobia bacterium]|nr:glycosyltransferase family 4 protein [Verrucomicrobiota bacterium]MDC0218417.1 glycosyltransferase family 4 protein [Verrucomicrobiota bacterium]
MNIALARREFGAGGGAELYLQRLIGALRDKGHEVVLVTADAKAKPEGVEVRRVPLFGSRSARIAQFDAGVQTVLASKPVDCLFSLERLSRQDVLRAGDGVHASWMEQRRRFSPAWKRWLVGRGAFHRAMMDLETRAYSPANTRHLIINSEMVARDVRARFGFPDERVHMVRNGVELERWQRGDREAQRAKWGLRPDEFLLLFAGSGWERKGLPFVIAALEKISDSSLKLVVAGKGRSPRNAPSGVRFVGPMADLENAYAAADLFVFPPVYEPSANVVFEALAAGLPVVTSACNGAAEVIEEGINGTVVTAPSDIEALVDAIQSWRACPNARPVPVKADLSLERNVRETLAVLELAAAERAAEER